MSSLLVSIIIPTYNLDYIIRETLDSVFEQTYSNWECIIVDDGSDDNTENVVKGYTQKDSRFQYYKRPNNKLKGANACRNYGVDKSKGEYLIFLDSDDVLEKNCLENRCHTVLQNKTKTDIFVFSMGLLVNNKKTESIFNKDFIDNENYIKQFLKGNAPWSITCVFWNKQVFIEVGQFDEAFQRLQDVDLHTRLLLNGKKIHRIHQVDTWYRNMYENKDYLSKERLPIIIKAHIRYIDKYWSFSTYNTNIDQLQLRYYLKDLYYYVLKKYVFKNKQVCFKEILELNTKNDIIKTNRLCYIKLLALYHKLGLNNKKGIGYFNIREKAFN